MSFQVLRGAIFGFVYGFEKRVLAGVEAIEIPITNLTELVMDTIQAIVRHIIGLSVDLVTAVVSEGFDLLRAGLTIVLGRPAEDEEGN